MTEADRKEAEQEAQDFMDWSPLKFHDDGSVDQKAIYVCGYLKACEAKRYGDKPCPVCGDHFETHETLQAKLEAERARSAKLFSVVTEVYESIHARGFQGSMGPLDENYLHDLTKNALDEYEASRD